MPPRFWGTLIHHAVSAIIITHWLRRPARGHAHSARAGQCRAGHNPTLARRRPCCSRRPSLAWSAGTRQPTQTERATLPSRPQSAHARDADLQPTSANSYRSRGVRRGAGRDPRRLEKRATPPQRPPRPVSRMGAQVRRRSCRSGHRAAFVLAFAFAFSRCAAGDRRSAAAAGVTPERLAPWPVGRCCWIGGHRRPPADGTAMSDQHRPDTTDACDDEGAEGMVEPTR